MYLVQKRHVPCLSSPEIFVTCTTKLAQNFFTYLETNAVGAGNGASCQTIPTSTSSIFAYSRHNPANFIPYSSIFQTRLLMHDSNYEALTQVSCIGQQGSNVEEVI